MQHGIITFLAQDYGQSPLPGRVEPPTHLFHRLRRNPSMGSQTNRSHCAMAVTGAACCLHGLAPPYRHGTAGLVIPAVAYINAAVFCAGLYLVTYTGTVAPYTYIMLGATRYGAKRARHTPLHKHPVWRARFVVLSDPVSAGLATLQLAIVARGGAQNAWER